MSNKNNKDEKDWKNSSLFILIITFIIVNPVTSYWERSCIRNNREQSLKLAFSGEVKAIRGFLESAVKNAALIWRQKKSMKVHKMVYPDAVYKANAANLGDLQDRNLIKQLVTLYSLLERNNEFARRIDEKIYEPNSFQSYLFYLTHTWSMSIALDMRLQEQTKNYQDMDWQVTVSKKDTDDQNFAKEILKELKPTDTNSEI